MNWSDRELTPLEAEVETERSSHISSKIVKDLVAAIRRDSKSSVFIVLGDPGSGKSVSLRRLVRVLCRRAQNTGIVPVYVNLREFPPNEKPTIETLLQFFRDMAEQQTGRDGRAFLDTWYEPFRKSGRLFFVIDSFDELPAVLDCDDKSDSHRQISTAFDRFFTQEIQSCRAVLASRQFRAPVGVKGTRLIIRPFRESQIRRAMRTWLLGRGIDTNRYIRRLFRERPQLVPLLRNPFTAELIAEYARMGSGENLPDNMFSIFDSYITDRLKSDQPTLERLKLNQEDVRETAAFIAKRMYQKGDLGLEADVDQIKNILKGKIGDKADAIIEALRYTRIAKVGGHDRRKFSFVHRRFAEFFVVDAIKETNELVDVKAIPTDSRWRDCLVMYCGIAKLPIRKHIANFCWSVIESFKENLNSGHIDEAREAVHCIRFLADAFRSDVNALSDFRDKLGNTILELLKSKDPLIAKIGAEGIPLINEASMHKAIVVAFEKESSWVCETTLGSCRHLGKLDNKTNNSIRNYLGSLPVLELIKRFGEINFSLSLSDAFRRQRFAIWADFIETLIFVFIATIMLISAAVYSFLLSSWKIILSYTFILIIVIFMATMIWYLGTAEYNLRYRLRKMSKEYFMKMTTIIMGRDQIDLILRWFILLGIAFAIPFSRQNPLYRLLIIIPLAVFIMFRWEGFYLIIKNLLAFKMKKIIKFLLMMIVLFSVIALIILGAIKILPQIWMAIPLRFQSLLKNVGEIIFYLFIIASFSFGLYFFGKIIIYIIQKFIERRKMYSLGLPTSITSQSVYETCLSFRTNDVRRLYLERLRQRQIPLKGEISEPPSQLLKNTLIAEELAKLREQWYGLAI